MKGDRERERENTKHISRLVLSGANLSIKVGSETEGREREREGERVERGEKEHKTHLQGGALWSGSVHQDRLRDRAGERERERKEEGRERQRAKERQ